MNIHKSSLFNACILLVFGAWGCLESTSVTAIIPYVIGGLLLFCNEGLKSKNKISSHIVVLLTLLSFSLFMPFLDRLESKEYMAVFRISIMLLSSFFAFYYQIKSFIEARSKAK